MKLTAPVRGFVGMPLAPLARSTSIAGKPIAPRLVPSRSMRRASPQSARAIAAPEMGTASADKGSVRISIDNSSESSLTKIHIEAPNRPGLLNTITATFRDLGVEVIRASVEGTAEMVSDTFYVRDKSGGQIPDADKETVSAALDLVIRARARGGLAVRRRPRTDATNSEHPASRELLYSLMDTYQKNDVLSIQEQIVKNVEYTIGRSRYRFDNFEAYMATAYSVRDRLIESWNDTNSWFKSQDPKRVYYLSMEFLMGRTLLNALENLDITPQYKEAVSELGYSLEKLAESERDAALGNGGLGRLASCFLDSMATLNLPAWGYGVRYQYGMFRQTMIDGFQHEQPDYWLTFGNPWEIERLNVSYSVKYYGHVSVSNDNGRQVFKWNAGEEVTAVAYDNPIPGFGTENTINLRLWSAKPVRQFDLEAFNTGDYVQAILARQRAETISSVLYPDDRTYEGKELRLKQQFFLCSATLQDVVRRYKEGHPDTWDLFPEKATFQLNDTHPTIAVPELMRILMDDHKIGWTKSWDICTKVFSFTNHTVMPEALEKWSIGLVEKVLPRHMQIIYDINWRFVQSAKDKVGDNWEKIGRMSIIEETPNGKFVRMANLALVVCHTVNGVAAIHSELIKETIFKDFYDIYPEKFQNKTNGVTQRRWMAVCNPPLRGLITDTLGSQKWITKLDELTGLRSKAEDPAFQQQWWDVKQAAKKRLAAKILELTGTKVSTAALFDIQVKRIHEYKRQLLNVLSIIYRYKQIKAMTPEQKKAMVPRVCIIGGKAAPGYEMAKRIIKLVSAVGDKINTDPDVGDLLKLVFIPDYNVSLAEVIVPGSELSQHISTAGTEASGTSNMKFAMNGCLIIGTMDGANVEIAEEIGKDNIFIFGALAHQVPKLRTERRTLVVDSRFTDVCNMIRAGTFGWPDYFGPIVDAITGDKGGDYYLVANDFPSYLAAQDQVDRTYKDQKKWIKMSILSTAGSGKFSSDRTIQEYADQIWKVKGLPRPASH